MNNYDYHDIEFYPLPSTDEPSSGYPGFDPHTEIFPAGHRVQPGRIPFACDTVCEQDVAIKLRDGTTIYADVYRPVTEEKVPAILSWGIAGKRGKNLAGGFSLEGVPLNTLTPENSTQSGLHVHNGPDPAVWVQYGYAIINPDPRGTYNSEGDVMYFGTQYAEDGCDVIEWAASQSWCSGKVGLAGTHWYALSEWFIAEKQPLHLAAIAPAEAHANLYLDEFVRDGIPRLDYTARLRTYTTHGARIEDICAMVEKHPFFDEYWQDKAVDFSKIHTPAWITASWTQTNHSRGVFEAFEKLGTEEKWLRVHDIGEFTDPRTESTVLDQKKFFDRYLKGEDNGWEKTPRVRLATLNPGGENITGRPEESFPLKNQRVQTLWLGENGCMRDEKPAAPGEVSYVSDDEVSVTTFTYSFDKPTEITGYLRLRLWVEAQSDDADVFVRLYKLDKDGGKLWTTHDNKYSGPNGRLRASHRELDEVRSDELRPVHTHRGEQRLTPGVPVPLDIGIWPTSLIFAPGEQLMLEVGGWEIKVAHFGNEHIPTRNKGRHTVHFGGEYDSKLLIPVIER
jgi:hypothetical protein